MADHLEQHIIEIKETLGHLTAHAENTHEDVAEIKDQMIPNGKDRMKEAEEGIKANTKHRYVTTAIISAASTCIGWAVAIFGGTHHG